MDWYRRQSSDVPSSVSTDDYGGFICLKLHRYHKPSSQSNKSYCGREISMAKRMSMQTQHGECFLGWKTPCRHCKEVQRREREQIKKDYQEGKYTRK